MLDALKVRGNRAWHPIAKHASQLWEHIRALIRSLDAITDPDPIHSHEHDTTFLVSGGTSRDRIGKERSSENVLFIDRCTTVPLFRARCVLRILIACSEGIVEKGWGLANDSENRMAVK